MKGCYFIDSLSVDKSAIKGARDFTTLHLQVKHDDTILLATEHPLDTE